MNPQTIQLDREHNEVVLTSPFQPQVLVTKLSFNLHRPDPHDATWSARYMGVMLKYASTVLDGKDPGRTGPLVSEPLSIGAQISPQHIQPVFDLSKAWRFQSATNSATPKFTEPVWRTRLWLEGFQFEEGESATVWVTTNAQIESASVIV